MSRTMIFNKKNECIGYFGDTSKELGFLVDFMKGKKEIKRETERNGKTNTIKITVD